MYTADGQDRVGDREVTTSEHAEETDDQLTQRITLISQWSEHIGSTAWRARAVRELSPAELEMVLLHADSLEGLSDAEREAISCEWEVFNSARRRRHKRQNILRGVLEFIDAGAAAISLFGVVGLTAWFFVPGMFSDEFGGWWLFFHLAVTGAYGLSLLIRLPKALRAWSKDRNGDRIAPARIKSELVFIDGQYLPGKLVPKSADEIALEKGFGRVFDVLTVVFVVGLFGALDAVKGYMPLWLSAGLMILSGLGLILLVRLRGSAQRVQSDLDRARAPQHR